MTDLQKKQKKHAESIKFVTQSILEIINNCDKKEDQESCPNTVFWFDKDGKLIFECKKSGDYGALYLEREKIYKPFAPYFYETNQYLWDNEKDVLSEIFESLLKLKKVTVFCKHKGSYGIGEKEFELQKNINSRKVYFSRREIIEHHFRQQVIRF